MARSVEPSGGKGFATHSLAPRVARALLAALLLPAPSRAASTTASFLKIPVDARAVGLGNGVTAVSEGAAAVTNNPAGLGLSARRELALLYAPHVQGTDLSFLAYGHPTRFGSFGLSHLMLRSGALDGRDDEGRPTGGFTAEDRALGVSWASPVGRVPLAGQVAAGLHVKYVASRIGSYQDSTYAFDLGAQSARRVAGLPARLGVAVRNLGPGLKLEQRSDPLPLNVVVGLAVQPFQMMTLSAGAARYLEDDRSEFSIGSELSPFSALVVRGNYGMVRSAGQSSQLLPLLSWGLGLRLARCQFDYALMPLGDLGSTQRLNLTMRFGEARARPGRLGWGAPSPREPVSRDLVGPAWQALREGRVAAAALQFERALRAEPGNGRLRSVLLRTRAAAQLMPEVSGMESWAPLARRGVAAYADGRDLRESVVFLRRAYDAAPGIAGLLGLLNLVEAAAGMPEPTRGSAYVRDSGFIDERLAGARQAIHDGRFEVAARRAAEATEVAPDDVRAWELLGSAQYMLGSRERAREAWERALKLDPLNKRVADFLTRLR